jgi:CRISPR type I-E-associated protein CasB/Cse2
MIDNAKRNDVARRISHELRAMQRGVGGNEHEPRWLAARAAWRTGMGKGFGDAPAADAALLRAVGDLVIDREGAPLALDATLGRLLDDAILVASTVAATGVPVRSESDDRTGRPRSDSLGRSMRALLDRQIPAAEPAFMALIVSARGQLPRHLGRAFQLLGSADPPIRIEPARLILDLGRWDADDRWVQRHWSYDFWSGAPSADPQTTTEDEA